MTSNESTSLYGQSDLESFIGITEKVKGIPFDNTVRSTKTNNSTKSTQES